MVVKRSEVMAFMDRELDDYRWLKNVNREALERQLSQFPVPPVFKTDPWTHQLVCVFIGMCQPRFMFLLDMGTGKAICDDELVLTPSGYVKMGTIKLGDMVIGRNGKPTRVIGVYPQGTKEVFDVTFTDRVTVQSCGDHIWRVRTSISDWQDKTLYELKDDLRYPRQATNKSVTVGNLKWFIPMADPVEFAPSEPVGLHPYVMGALLGNGGLSGGACSITCHADDNDIVDRIRELVPRGIEINRGITVGNVVSWSIKGNHDWMRKFLRKKSLNVLSRLKHIPQEYMQASVQDRQQMVAGLLDTDGYAMKSGAFEFSSTSSSLAHQFQELIHSLGGIATLVEYKNEFGPYWRIHGRTAFNPFLSHRKAQVYGQGRMMPSRSIRSVVSVGTKSCTCIRVENRNGLFLLRGCVVTHNSKILMDLITQVQREKKLKKALITVPRVINIDSWRDDLLVHSNLEPWGCDVEETDEKYERLIEAKGDVTFINYAGLHLALSKKEKFQGKMRMVRDEKKMRQFHKVYNWLGIDESHMLSSSNNLWFGIFNQISQRMDYCYGCTGTLFGKKMESIWSQFKLVDRGETFGENLGLFRAGLFEEKQDPWKVGGVKYVFNDRMQPTLHRMLQHRSIRYDQEEIPQLELPSLTMRKQYVSMSEEQREHYMNAWQGVINANGDLREMEAKYIRMRQIISGYLVWSDRYGDHVKHFKVNTKLNALERLIEEMGDSKIVVPYTYTETGRLIVERLKVLKIGYEWFYGGTKDKSASRENFMTNPNCRVFVMQSSAGGTGNNGLQNVARYMVMFETPTEPNERKQVIKRIHRPPQNKRVFVYDLVMERSIDKGILEDHEAGIDNFAKIVNGKGMQMMLTSK